MNTSKESQKKRQWLQIQWIVIPKLQNEIILASTFSTVVVIVIFLTNQSYVYAQLTSMAVTGKLGLELNTLEAIYAQAQTQIFLFTICGLLTLAFGFSFGLYLSNRIAGPIFRLNKQLDLMIEGKDYSELKFRPKDYLQETADKINLLAEQLKKGNRP